MKIPFFVHNVGVQEKTAIADALDQIFLTTGSITNAFEEKFADYVGAKHAVGLTSCTAALHLGLLACDVGPGDEVITTPMTFVATSLAIIHCGATPVLVDVEADTGNIDADKIEEKITSKTKAILPVHLYGQMCDMKKIKQIADKHSLKLIEDAAHALTASRDGIRVGQNSDAACFSFYATKSITSGEGGALTTNNEALYKRVKSLRSHGMTGDAASRYTRNYEHWDLAECGWKCNMDNIKAAMLIPQLDKAKKVREQRKAVYNEYYKHLAGVKDIRLPKIVENAESDYHLLTVWVNKEKRDKILTGLQAQGIGVAVNYRAIHLLKALKEKFDWKAGDFPNAEHIGDSTISLPLYSKLTVKEVDYVCTELKRLT